jgi:hypothetical protein
MDIHFSLIVRGINNDEKRFHSLTFYGSYCYCIISYSICHFHSHSPQPNVCEQGQEPTIRMEAPLW